MNSKLLPIASARWRCLLLVSLGASIGFGQTLKEVAKFDLPGPGGKRFDYLTIDPEDHYLISAHLGADQTYVIDLQTNKVVATVKDTPGADSERTLFANQDLLAQSQTALVGDLVAVYKALGGGWQSFPANLSAGVTRNSLQPLVTELQPSRSPHEGEAAQCAQCLEKGQWVTIRGIRNQ